MSLFQKYRAFIYLLFAIFALGCKNDNTKNDYQDVETDVVVDTLSVEQNYISIKIMGMPETEGVMTITDYVSGESNFTPKFKLLTLPDSNSERLFVQYFSGGAHCCTNLQVYKFNSDADAFEYLDEYSYDGDPAEIEYPFRVNY